MAKYIINYDLKKPGTNYEDLYKALTSYDHIHPLESCWIIETTGSVLQIKNFLETKIDKNDKLFVSDFIYWASSNFTEAEKQWLHR